MIAVTPFFGLEAAWLNEVRNHDCGHPVGHSGPLGTISLLPFTTLRALSLFVSQIRCSSIEGMYDTPLNRSSIGRWIKSELSGFNVTEVVCVDDDQVTDSFLQFRVPIEDDMNYPKVCKHRGKSFAVDHALSYATPIGMRACPPHEQSVHEHWKKAARLAPIDKKCHANSIAKSENCPRSLQRVNLLRESSVQHEGATFAIYTEQTKMPWCFFTGSVSEQVAIDCFCQYGIRHLENKEDIEKLLTLGEELMSL